MKKKLSKLTALMILSALMVLPSSCQKEESGISPEQTNEVTFNLAVDNVTRSSTAPSRYIMEIYKDDALDQRYEEASSSFTVSLIEMKEYTILFYADYGTPNAASGNEYDTSDLRVLKVLSQPTNVCYATSKSLPICSYPCHPLPAVPNGHRKQHYNLLLLVSKTGSKL